MLGRRRLLAVAGGLMALALAAALVTGGLGSRGGNAVAAETTTTRTVTVNGEGRVSLAPDVVTMQLGVDVLDADLATAQSRAATQMDAVIDALRDAGVAELDIQTSGYSINVERDYNQTTQPITGYRVMQTVSAKVREIDGAGAVIAAAVDAGANNVHGVWFALDDPSTAMTQARELAVADARAKAEELARLTNSTLGHAQAVVEGYGSPTQPVMYEGYAGADAAKSLAPTMNPGQTEVVLNVQVSYVLN